MEQAWQVRKNHYLYAMIIAFFIIFAIATICLDFIAWRRIDTQHRTSRAAAGVVLLILNALPFITIAITAIAKDNSQTLMTVDSWALTIYTIATMTRVLFYIPYFTIKSRVIGIIVGAIAGLCIFSVLCNGVINTRTALTVKQVKITDSNIPHSFNGFRILFFSDLHIGAMISAQCESKALANLICEQKADMIIFGGDLIHIRHDELTEEVAKELSRIVAPYGTYCVFGNHDTGVYIKDYTDDDLDSNISRLRDKIAAMGWIPLQDSTIYATIGNDSIAVTGIDFTKELLEYKHSYKTPEDYSPTELFEQVPADVFNIAISHLPQLWEPLSNNNFADLILSGHTHATQIAVECFGYRISPAMLLHKQWSGLYSDNNSQLYITDGIGCVGFYMRIGATPEVTVIELTR